MPVSSFKGANRVLPETQALHAGASILASSEEMHKLRVGLQLYYEETGQPYILQKDFLELKEKFSLPAVPWRTAQSVYYVILEELGQVGINGHGLKMAYQLVVICAVITYCESQNPPLSILSETGYSKPLREMLDWQQILFHVLDSAPDWLDTFRFTIQYCRKAWYYIESQDTGPLSLVFEKHNWETLRGVYYCYICRTF